MVSTLMVMEDRSSDAVSVKNLPERFYCAFWVFDEDDDGFYGFIDSVKKIITEHKKHRQKRCSFFVLFPQQHLNNIVDAHLQYVKTIIELTDVEISGMYTIHWAGEQRIARVNLEYILTKDLHNSKVFDPTDEKCLIFFPGNRVGALTKWELPVRKFDVLKSSDRWMIPTGDVEIREAATHFPDTNIFNDYHMHNDGMGANCLTRCVLWMSTSIKKPKEHVAFISNDLIQLVFLIVKYGKRA